MTRIPSLTSRQFVSVLKKAGYVESRQTGSHLTLKHQSRPPVVVPVHARDLNRRTMMRIVKRAGFSDEEFLDLL